MGRAIAALARDAGDVQLVGGIARTSREGAEAEALGYPAVTTPADAGAILRAADVLIDVSAPAALEELLRRYAPELEGRALVVGTTGLDAGVTAQLDAAAERSAVLVAANFSVGANVLLFLVEEAARLLAAERFDAEIVEAHHRRKADAPSGTALALGAAVARARGQALERVRRDGRSGRTGERAVGEIAFHALRGGGVVGEHRVHFLGERERLELAHAAADRSVFAEGALETARWLAGRPAGRYSMRDVLGGMAAGGTARGN